MQWIRSIDRSIDRSVGRSLGLRVIGRCARSKSFSAARCDCNALSRVVKNERKTLYSAGCHSIRCGWSSVPLSFDFSNFFDFFDFFDFFFDFLWVIFCALYSQFFRAECNSSADCSVKTTKKKKKKSVVIFVNNRAEWKVGARVAFCAIFGSCCVSDSLLLLFDLVTDLDSVSKTESGAQKTTTTTTTTTISARTTTTTTVYTAAAAAKAVDRRCLWLCDMPDTHVF